MAVAQSPGADAPPATARSLVLPFKWRQGEHMAILGRTGSGKSQLLARLIEARAWRIIIRTKPDDVEYRDAITVSTLRGLERDRKGHAYVLDPDYDEQSPEIWATLEWAYRTGGWAIAIDECFYVAELGIDMEREIKKLMTQGRSLKITMINGTQRPVDVPRFVISEASHVIAFGLEGRDAKIVRDAAGERLAEAVTGLRRYEFAWWSVVDRKLWTGRLNLRSGRLEETGGYDG